MDENMSCYHDNNLIEIDQLTYQFEYNYIFFHLLHILVHIRINWSVTQLRITEMALIMHDKLFNN